MDSQQKLFIPCLNNVNDGEPFVKNSFKLPKGYSEAGIRRRTDITVGKKDKREKTISGRQSNTQKTRN